MMKTDTDKKQSIKDTMLALIAERGLHDTPMSLVAKRAGVSAGAIYHHFESKDALITEVYLDIKKHVAAALLPSLHTATSYEDRFLNMWKSLYTALSLDPLKLSLMEQCTTSPLITDEAKAKGEQYMAPMLTFLDDGMKDGILKAMPLYLLGYWIYGTITSTTKLHLSGILTVTDDHIDTAARCCWDGVKA